MMMFNNHSSANSPFSSLSTLKHSFTTIALSGLALMLPVNSIYAQDERKTETIEEMIVTANKRETNLLETALAVTALSQDTLDRAGVANLVDIENLVPNLQIGLSPH